MLTDLFLTPAWFELLREHGLERQPYAVRNVTFSSVDTGQPGQLWLQQPLRRGPWCSLANYYTGTWGPVGGDLGVSAEHWAVAAREIRSWPGAGVIILEPLVAPSVEAMEEGLRSAGYRTRRAISFGNWYQPVEPGRFDAYWSERPSTLKNTVERARRRLDRDGAGWSVDIYAPGEHRDTQADDEALCRLRDAYLQVYARSWKPQEPKPAFIPAFMRLAAGLGCLRLGVLSKGDEPLAAQLWLVYPGHSAQIFKLAYVSGEEKWSAGSVLTAAMAQHAINVDRVKELDFLSGDDAYKADWMGCRRERVRLTACDLRSKEGLIAWCRYRLSGLLRAAWKIASPVPTGQ